MSSSEPPSPTGATCGSRPVRGDSLSPPPFGPIQDALAELAIHIRSKLEESANPRDIVGALDTLIDVQRENLNMLLGLREVAVRTLVNAFRRDENSNGGPSSVSVIPIAPAPAAPVDSTATAARPVTPAPANPAPTAPAPAKRPAKPSVRLSLPDRYDSYIQAKYRKSHYANPSLHMRFLETLPPNRRVKRQGAFIEDEPICGPFTEKDTALIEEATKAAQKERTEDWVSDTRAPKRQRSEREAEMSEDDEEKQEGPSNKRARKDKSTEKSNSGSDGEGKKLRRSPRPESRRGSPSPA